MIDFTLYNVVVYERLGHFDIYGSNVSIPNEQGSKSLCSTENGVVHDREKYDCSSMLLARSVN